MACFPDSYHLIALDTVDSTNEDAKRRIKGGALPGTVVWARQQTAGRGRRGRPWSSPPGNLYLSLAVQPKRPRTDAAQLSFLAGVVVAETVAAHLPSECRITLKWPNDVLVEGAKVSGVLLEGENDPGGEAPWVIVGIGLNVESSPVDTLYPATHLERERSDVCDLTVLCGVLISRWADWYARWEAIGFSIIRTAWLDRAHNFNGDIIAKLPNETIEGRFVDLDVNGELVLETREGRTMKINAADIYFPAARSMEFRD